MKGSLTGKDLFIHVQRELKAKVVPLYECNCEVIFGGKKVSNHMLWKQQKCFFFFNLFQILLNVA